MPLVELPQEADRILAAWRETIKAPPMTKSRVDAQTNQNILDTVTLLQLLTVQADQGPIFEREMNELRNQVNIVTEERNAAEAATHMLRTELAAARSVAAALARAALAPPAFTGDDIPFPDKFDGTQSKLRAFVTHLRLKVASYPEEQTKLCIAVNCLTGQAMDLVQQYVRDDRVALDNLGALIDILDKAFGNPNRVSEAEAKLRSLQQGTRDFRSYYAEFQRYACEVQWAEIEKLSVLKKGLAYGLKNDLVTVSTELNNIADFVALCNNLDTKRRALQNESTTRSHAPKRATTDTTTTTTATTSSGTAPGPRDLSANRRRLSPKERARRWTEGCCYRCGEVGHMARACPLGQHKPMRGAEVVLSLQAQQQAPQPAVQQAPQPAPQLHF